MKRTIIIFCATFFTISATVFSADKSVFPIGSFDLEPIKEFGDIELSELHTIESSIEAVPLLMAYRPLDFSQQVPSSTLGVKLAATTDIAFTAVSRNTRKHDAIIANEDFSDEEIKSKPKKIKASKFELNCFDCNSIITSNGVGRYVLVTAMAGHKKNYCPQGKISDRQQLKKYKNTVVWPIVREKYPSAEPSFTFDCPYCNKLLSSQSINQLRRNSMRHFNLPCKYKGNQSVDEFMDKFNAIFDKAR